ncbi:Lipoprotein signal peptidase [Gemmatirosa kalamazoonensis]|uniref:Lipoprotein signal peptidase n=1 Tax=Gemmatirosa kalamazoonensis TaxID=861299 RepID=W0RJH9_9BACT|nr:Lipoprotein signal peptidase [Gemmatirosa kalamazoonensis]
MQDDVTTPPAERPTDTAYVPFTGSSSSDASTNGVVFWPVVLAVVLADVVTKAMAVYALHPPGVPYAVAGDAVRLTLVYNPGAAFGLHLGPYSRWIFLALTAGVLSILWRLYKQTRDRDNLRTFALALVCGGAVGNALDRLRSAEGVVDFLDLGTGAVRWPTFNLADVAVSVGAFLLAWVLWGDDPAAEPAMVTERPQPTVQPAVQPSSDLP